MPDARAQVVSTRDISRCATIAADPARLACYDQLARGGPPAAVSASASSPAIVPPASAPSEGTDQSFGIAKTPASKPPEPSRMEARVREIMTGSRGEVLVQLDNDQSWQLDDGPAILHAGDQIVIKRAALGSFLMTTPTSRVYRVRRLR